MSTHRKNQVLRIPHRKSCGFENFQRQLMYFSYYPLDFPNDSRRFFIQRFHLVKNLSRFTENGFIFPMRVLYRQVICFRYPHQPHSPTRSSPNRLKFSLKFYKLGQVVFVERISLAQVTLQIELIKPDLRVGAPFQKEQYGFNSSAGKVPRANPTPYADYSFLGRVCANLQRHCRYIRQKVFLITTPALPPALRILMKCWRNRKRGRAGVLIGGILLNFSPAL